MAVSQNNWAVIHSGSSPQLTKLPHVTGRVRAGDVFTVLSDLCEQFDAHVEEIVKSDSWGYAYRAVRGGRKFSNHASGTAVDLNATKHGMYMKGTFSSAQIAKMRHILKRYIDPKTGRCIVRWGEDYVRRRDGMHFEIHNADQAAVARVAANLRKAASKKSDTAAKRAEFPTPENYPLKSRRVSISWCQRAFREGFRSDSIQTVQMALRELEPDGYLGPKTLARFRAVMGPNSAPGGVPSTRALTLLLRNKIASLTA